MTLEHLQKKLWEIINLNRVLMYHKPVMLHQCIDALNIRRDGVYVDVTFGGGGHSAEILKHIPQGKLFAFDQDPDAMTNHPGNENLTLIQQNFRYMINYLRFYDAIPVDGILADLGISSHQIDVPERGFATRYNSLLDMRMDQKGSRSAADILNNASIEEMARIFKQYGELKNGYPLAKRIATAREEHPVDTTDRLNEIATPLSGQKNANKYLAQVYQALRIEVNDELGALKDLLYQAEKALKPGGTLVIMSYHSLEDRLVKNFLKSGNFEGKQEKDFFGNPMVPFKTIKNKPITADEKEIEENPRSRSARLRIGIKL